MDERDAAERANAPHGEGSGLHVLAASWTACRACGQRVDAHRAPVELIFTSGSVVLCSAACHTRYVTERRAPMGVRVSLPTAEPVPPLAREVERRDSPLELPRMAPFVASEVPSIAPPPWLAVGFVVAALIASVLATGWTGVGVAAVFATAAATIALPLGAHVRESAGWLAFVSAPIGTGLLVVSGILVHAFDGDARRTLAAAALGGALANARWWLDAGAQSPRRALARSTSAGLPDEARRVVAAALGGAERVATESLRVGDEVVVSAGQIVVVDGVVRGGKAKVLRTLVSQAAETLREGDGVLAGARVVSGEIRVLATRTGRDRAVVAPRRFGDPQRHDAATPSRWVRRFGPLAVGFAIAGALAAGLLASNGGSFAERLATVGAVCLGLPWLALRRVGEDLFEVAGFLAVQRGIVFESARAMEVAGRTRTVVLSTRGTLGQGEPEIVDTLSFDDPEREALLLASAIEADIDHPIARAIASQQRGRALPTIRKVTPVAGRGVLAVGPHGESVVLGTRQLLLDEGVSAAMAEADAERLESLGLSVVFVAVDHKVRAILALRDEIRPGARAAVQRLFDLELDVQLVSGDHRGTVATVASQLDIEHVKAELDIQERVAEIKRLHDVGGQVAVIGAAGVDPEITQAGDVAILLSAAGVASADRSIALASDDLRDASAALWLAHMAVRDADRALRVAAFGGAFLVLLAAIGLLSGGLVAMGALAIDLYVLPLATRFMQRAERRLPSAG